MAVDCNGKSKAEDNLERAAPPFRRSPMVLRLPLHEPARVGAVDAARRALLRLSRELGAAGGLRLAISQPG